LAHREHNPVIYVEHLTASLFLEGHEDMLAYRRMVDRLTVLALMSNNRGSRLPTWQASTTDRKAEHDPRVRPGPGLAEEQLQRRRQRGCIEVAWPEPLVAVRDSKHPTGPTLTFPNVQWSTFLRIQLI